MKKAPKPRLQLVNSNQILKYSFFNLLFLIVSKSIKCILIIFRWIMAEEKELGLIPTVTQAEIDACYER